MLFVFFGAQQPKVCVLQQFGLKQCEHSAEHLIYCSTEESYPVSEQHISQQMTKLLFQYSPCISYFSHSLVKTNHAAIQRKKNNSVVLLMIYLSQPMASLTAAFLPDVSCPLITLHSWQEKRLSAFCNHNSLFLKTSFTPLMQNYVHPSQTLKFLLIRGPAKLSSDQCAIVIPTNIPHVLQDLLRLKDIILIHHLYISPLALVFSSLSRDCLLSLRMSEHSPFAEKEMGHLLC